MPETDDVPAMADALASLQREVFAPAHNGVVRMFIELTLADGNRPWLFSWPIAAMGRSLDGSATLVTTQAGVTMSVVERPEVIAEIVMGNDGGAFAVLRQAKP